MISDADRWGAVATRIRQVHRRFGPRNKALATVHGGVHKSGQCSSVSEHPANVIRTPFGKLAVALACEDGLPSFQTNWCKCILSASRGARCKVGGDQFVESRARCIMGTSMWWFTREHRKDPDGRRSPTRLGAGIGLSFIGISVIFAVTAWPRAPESPSCPRNIVSLPEPPGWRRWRSEAAHPAESNTLSNTLYVFGYTLSYKSAVDFHLPFGIYDTKLLDTRHCEKSDVTLVVSYSSLSPSGLFLLRF